jgi:hypothetical protein
MVNTLVISSSADIQLNFLNFDICLSTWPVMFLPATVLPTAAELAWRGADPA